MELKRIIYIYSISNKNKIIGKLENVSKKESLKNIRPKIKKMSPNAEFVKPKNNNTYDIFDKEMEGDFSLEDILIEEYGDNKIFIKESNIKNNIISNNINNNNCINKNNVSDNFENKMINNNVKKINMNINNDIFNNMYNNNNNININMPNNEINNISNMNINNMNNDFNIDCKINMNNNMINKINNINFMNNVCNFNNNVINNQNNINNMNNNNNFMNIKNKFNEQMNDMFMLSYKVNFQTNNGINYIINVNGRKKIYRLLDDFENKMVEKTVVHDFSFFYNGQEIKTFDRDNLTTSDIFKNNKNPLILVKDYYHNISKLILVTFQVKQNGEKYEQIFNSNSSIIKMINDFCKEIDNYYQEDRFKFLYNKKYLKIDYSNNITLSNLFKNDSNPMVFVNDKNNLIGKKIKVNFETNHGYKHELNINSGYLIGNLLQKYLDEIEEIFDLEYLSLSESEKFIKVKDKIQFSYKGKQIMYNQNDHLNHYFKNDYNPKIFVNDANNLFLINWNAYRNITFKTNHGYINNIIINNKELYSNMFDRYFDMIGHSFLFRKDLIQFNHNGNQIIYNQNIYNNITVGEYFQNESYPIIFVNDVNNYFFINWDQSKNITFRTNKGYEKNIISNNKTSINDILRNFLHKIDHYELVNNNEIKYLYNSYQIMFEGLESIGEYFLNDNNPLILVIDINQLLNPIDVTFKTTNGNNLVLTINYTRTVGNLLMDYLDKVAHSELIERNDKIQFLYKAQQFIFGNKSIVGELFKNDNNPVILVMDINNLLSNNMITKINVIFNKDGIKIGFAVNYGTTIEQLLLKYLYRLGEQELIDSYYSKNYFKINKMKFSFNNDNIKFNDQNFVENYFRNNSLVHILVSDL